MGVVSGEKASSEMDSRFRGNDVGVVRGACARLDRRNDGTCDAPMQFPIAKDPGAESVPVRGQCGGAEGGKDAPPAEKFTISLYFKGLRRKNREKAGRKPTERRAKAGEKQGGFGVGIRRAGPPRFDAVGQAGVRRRGDADMQCGSSSAICDCRTPGLPLAGPRWMDDRWGNAFSPAFGSGDDVGKIIVHPFPNVKHKIRTSGRRGGKVSSEMDSRFRGNDEGVVRGVCPRPDRGNDETRDAPMQFPIAKDPGAESVPVRGQCGGAEGSKDAPPAEKFAISLHFKGLRRKNREKAGRKPAKRKAKAGEKQGRFGVGIRRAGPARFGAPGQAGARRRGEVDMQCGSGSAICDCRTPGLPLAGSG